ncbi:hypothetical protein EXIGLDRAFT_727865 [Exidia glandulosa HHB12029]|uniref:Uncharacterized protein n=1 Tax=Exidia glandulosa HHB12029 TaxID=1314781 RepID=A0A165LY59_EXIGL|nr:hypothetical protein EXIGLDRAFT_727865 [Exidia glandulosa HHB12029]
MADALPPTEDASYDPNALLREIFSRPSQPTHPVRDPSRAPILVQDYTSSPTPLAWRSDSRSAVVDYQYTNERNPRWMCPSCDFKDYDAHIVAEHRAGTHKSSEGVVMVRYFFVE